MSSSCPEPSEPSDLRVCTEPGTRNTNMFIYKRTNQLTAGMFAEGNVICDWVTASLQLLISHTSHEATDQQ